MHSTEASHFWLVGARQTMRKLAVRTHTGSLRQAFNPRTPRSFFQRSKRQMPTSFGINQHRIVICSLRSKSQTTHLPCEKTYLVRFSLSILASVRLFCQTTSSHTTTILLWLGHIRAAIILTTQASRMLRVVNALMEATTRSLRSILLWVTVSTVAGNMIWIHLSTLCDHSWLKELSPQLNAWWHLLATLALNRIYLSSWDSALCQHSLTSSSTTAPTTWRSHS